MYTEEHHYRHVLISRIRKVWADSTSATPKKYSYAEWAYFLKLLGEDESDSSRHEASPSPPSDAPEDMPHSNRKESLDPDSPKPKGSEAGDHHNQQTVQAPIGKENEAKALSSWSWIGSGSPLMGDKAEAEWLLEKLFQRLEESLHDVKKDKATLEEQGTAKLERGKAFAVDEGQG